MNAPIRHDQDSRRLATGRLILRRPVVGDLAAVARLANTRAIADNLSTMPHPYALDDAKAWFETLDRVDSNRGAAFVATLAETDEIIGCAGWGTVPDRDLPHVGFWVGKPYWGRGLATEAAHAVIDHVFSTSDLDIIGCGCRVINGAARRVIEKSGFQYDGLGMVHFQSHGGTLPILKYQLDRATWSSLKAWGAESAA